MTLLNPISIPTVPLGLENGDRLTRAEFHELYQRAPKDFKAELIGGIVYVASPLSLNHGTNHLPLGAVLFAYESATPGTQSGDNTTIILGDDSEPQPDLFLRILPEFGGRTTTTHDDYVGGAPELVIEIALSSRSIDLHSKREDYRKYGVREYLVASLQEQRLFWFDLPSNLELSATNGIVRVNTFPGLWIDTAAVFAKDFAQLMNVLNQGLRTAEHSKFRSHLAGQKR